jgi:hypothetical protein
MERFCREQDDIEIRFADFVYRCKSFGVPNKMLTPDTADFQTVLLYCLNMSLASNENDIMAVFREEAAKNTSYGTCTHN